MNKDTVFKLLSGSLTAIYGFTYARTDNAEDAEDLAEDIIEEVAARAESIRNDDSFYGFMWAVAKNLSSRYFRNKSRCFCSYDESTIPAVTNTPEHELIANEEIMLLRRELSLLAERHRSITVKYYIEGKSCTAIAAETGLSYSLVRYILYETRKILKEGVNMERAYGERSYSPQQFELYGYFAYSNYDHSKPFRERKLPGNILLAAYDRYMTIQELSLELGVSAPYLEDEVSMLISEGLLAETKGKYITSLPVFDDEFFDSFEKSAGPVIKKVSEEISSMLKSIILPMNIASPKWMAFLLAMRFGILKATCSGWDHIGRAPILPHGSQGVLFGKTAKQRDYMLMNINAFNYNAERTAYITHYCYDRSDIERAESLDWARYKALTDIMLGRSVDINSKSVLMLIENGFISIENNKISVLFPVITENEMRAAQNALEAVSVRIAEMFNTLSECAENLAYAQAPMNLKETACKAAYMGMMPCGLGMVYEQIKDEFVLPQNSSFVGVIKAHNKHNTAYQCIT